jgi:macrodomain Ter protein organizer (MatP/YcbG family)
LLSNRRERGGSVSRLSSLRAVDETETYRAVLLPSVIKYTLSTLARKRLYDTLWTMNKTTNIRVYYGTWKRLKLMAVKKGKTLMELLDELSRLKI